MSAASDPYREELAGGVAIVPTTAAHAAQLEALQEVVFPDLAPAERFRAEHYRHHVAMFPEGQFVAVHGERVVGMTSSLRLDFDFDHAHGHTFADVLQEGWLSAHEPDGAWLYGADVGTHPDYRRRGIARALYRARQHTARRLGLRGQVTVGLLNGYGAVRDGMTPAQYYDRLVSGQLTDPTVSAQMRLGFQPRGVVENYVNDPTCGNCGVLLVLDAGHDV